MLALDLVEEGFRFMFNRIAFMAGAVFALSGVVLGGAPPMAGEHMNSPFHRQMVNVFVLPEMQQELGLTPQQITALQHQRQELLGKSNEIAGQIAVRRRELDQLLSGDTSRTRTVKALFDQIAGLQAQLQYGGFDTASKMKAVLNSGQRAQFNAMKPMDLHRVMMSRGNMAEIEQTMQRMGVESAMAMKADMSMKPDMATKGEMAMKGGMGMHGASKDASQSKDGVQDPPATDNPHSGHDHH